jgi:hypothetical protein
VRFVVAVDLDTFADGGTDECAFDRLMVIDGRARYCADNRAARLAVVMAMVVAIVMMRRCEGASGRQKEREAQQCRLDFLAYHVITSALRYCEIGAGKLSCMSRLVD